MGNDILRMLGNNVRDVSELPIFAEGKYDNIKIALQRGIFNKPTYFYATDLNKIGYIDSNLKLHVDGDKNSIPIQRVETLPSAEDAKDNVIYIFNNIAYLYNDGVYDPIGADYSTEIRNIQLDIENIKSNMSKFNERLSEAEKKKFVTEAPTISQFPSIGKENHTYVCLSENATYRWDSENLKYICTGRDYNNIKKINGGNANT